MKTNSFAEGGSFKQIWNNKELVMLKTGALPEMGVDSYDVTAYIRLCGEVLEREGITDNLFANVFVVTTRNERADEKEMLLYMPYISEETSRKAIDILERDLTVREMSERHGLKLEDIGPGFYDEGTRALLLSRDRERVRVRKKPPEPERYTDIRTVKGVKMYHELPPAIRADAIVGGFA